MRKARILWLLFILQIPLTVCSVTGAAKGDLLTQVTTYLPLIIMIIHACWTLNVKRGLAFIILAGLIGWSAEAFSLHYGTLFGGKYTYPAQASFFGVPLSIVTYWAVFIYLGYWLVTTFLLWLGKEKPNRKHHSLAFLGMTVLADGLVVTAIDLFMDPTSVKAGSWTWTNGGPYFGVPVGNFVGWFLVTVIVAGLFRSFEYHSPQPEIKVHISTLLLPVFGYLLAGIAFLSRAISYDMLLLAFIGAMIVIAPAVINVVLCVRFGHFSLRPLKD